MKVKSRTHVYTYLPDYKCVQDCVTLINRKLPKEEQVVVRLSVIGLDEDDAYQRESLIAARKFSPEKAQEVSEARFKKLVEQKFHGCSGLEVEGVEGDLDTWDKFFQQAPREIVSDVIQALRSTEQLSAGEQKNFLPESDGR